MMVMVIISRKTHTELVQEFEAALDRDLSEAVAAIQTLLQLIRNCKGT